MHQNLYFVQQFKKKYKFIIFPPSVTRPVARQDSSPDIAHFVSGKFYVRDLDFDMTYVCVCVCVCVCGGGRGGGGGRAGSICLYTK